MEFVNSKETQYYLSKVEVRKTIKFYVLFHDNRYHWDNKIVYDLE